MNESFRDILPLLRPRSAEPTVVSQTVWYLMWVGLATLLALYLLRWHRMRRQRREEFYLEARTAGLSTRQTDLLFEIAGGMKKPGRALSSAHIFDRLVGRRAARLVRRNRQHPQLAAIGLIRSILSFDEIPLDQPLSSTRQVGRGQTVMVWEDAGHLETEGFAPWLVLERDEGALTLTPLLRSAPGAGQDQSASRSPGDEITARFWREGDTEYRFTAAVVGPGTGPSALLVDHAPVARMQQRDFYRISVDFPIALFAVPQGAPGEPGSRAAAAAAVDLLHGSEPAAGGDPGVEVRTPPADVDRTPRDSSLAAATRVSGRVANLSAGGFAVRIDESEAAALPTGGSVWIVDPTFSGPFPLAGVACAQVGSERRPGGSLLKLRFEALPPLVEKEIVRGVYQHQLGEAASPGAAGSQDGDTPAPGAASGHP